MPIDASIAMGGKLPQFESPTNQLMALAQLQHAQGQNELAQAQRQEYMHGLDEKNRLKTLLGSQGFNGATPEGMRAMSAISPEYAQKYAKDQSAARKSQAEADKHSSEAAKLRIGLYRDMTADIKTPEDAAAWLGAQHADPQLSDIMKSQGTLEQHIGRIPQSADGLADWVKQQSLGMGKYVEQNKPDIRTQNLGGNSVVSSYPGLGGAPTQLSSMPITQSADNAATQATSRANNAATVAASMRGQDMSAASALGANGKAPAGYIWGPVGADGNPTMIAAKGGPADFKMVGALNADTQALSGSSSSFDRLGAAANEVLQHPGLNSVYGLRGVVPNIPGSKAADAAALLNMLKSQVGFSVLQDMRNNSKTGGALGAISDKENLMLQANLAALEKAQSFQQAQASLKKIIEYSDAAKGRLREAYNMRHGEGSSNPAKPTAPVTPKAVNFMDLK